MIRDDTEAAPQSSVKVLTLQLKPTLSNAYKPQELIQIKGHAELTLNARRAITILWHNAHRQGIRAGRDYTIEIDELKPDAHKGYEMVVEAVEALMRTLLIVKLPDGKDRRVQFLGGNDMTDSDRPAGVLTYSFDHRLIELLEQSAIYGKIALPVLMAFTSKYAISFYENIAQKVNLSNINSYTYTIDEFREMIGVQGGKYPVFGDLNRHVIKTAVAEINALASFSVAIMPIKKGKKVDQIMVGWQRKEGDALQEAWAESQRTKLGRRARIGDQVESVIDATSSIGREMRKFRRRLTSPKTS